MPLFLPTYFASLVVARGLNHTIFPYRVGYQLRKL